jgi:hypothetical protein
VGPVTAIFVSAANGLDTNDGRTPTRPVATIAQGLAQLTASGRQTLAIVTGQYTHPLQFNTGTVRLVGIASSAARLCNPADFPVITSSTPTGLEVSGGSITVEQLRVIGAEGSAAQRSSYGAWVSGGTVALVDVTLEAGRGASGVTPNIATTPQALVCDGLTDCADGGTGLAGSAGAPTDGGTFTPQGFVPGAGGRGTSGSRGLNGTASVPQEYGNCVSQCTGSTPCVSGDLFCGAIGFGRIAATPGRCGCGGAGAAPGEGGPGGGASIGLLVTGTGAVTVTGGRLLTGRGGNGAPGGMPSAPLPGSTGTAGAPATCFDFGAGGSCSRSLCVAQCIPSGPMRTVTATTGGRGGPGGIGGIGGGGAGGPSLGWVRVGGTAMVTVSPQTSIATSGGGTGAAGARDGLDAPQLVWP